MAIFYISPESLKSHPDVLQCIEKYYGEIESLEVVGWNFTYRVNIPQFGPDVPVVIHFSFSFDDGMKITEVSAIDKMIRYLDYGDRPTIR